MNPRYYLSAAVLAAVSSLSAHAEVTSLTLIKTEPFAAGHVFGSAGAYERVQALAHGELDPRDARNADIVGLQEAARNARGKVDYEVEVFMLRPANAAQGNGKLLYEVTNRGNKFMLHWLLDAPGRGGSWANDPKTLEDSGNGLFFREGYTMVWSGWDADVPADRMKMIAPATLAAGQPLVRTIREELVAGTRSALAPTLPLSYSATSLDTRKASLTVRRNEADAARIVPPGDWEYVDARQIRLLPAGTAFEPGSLYEISYAATGSKVQGVGFAATRDLVAYLRQTQQPRVKAAFAVGISQSGRFLRDFIGQGFNQDETGHKVFDGVLSHIAGIGRVFLNADFAQPGRTNTQHEDHSFPENAFPFASARTRDPVSGTTAQLMRGDGFDPLLIEVNTATEYWQKGASLLHTDPRGLRDLALPANTRVYMIAGTQHAGRVGLTTKPGACVNPMNPHSSAPALRALMLDLDAWVSRGVAPPPSRVPTLAAGTLVAAEKLNFPAIPGFAVATHGNSVNVVHDWLKRPTQTKPSLYQPLVARVDADGNEVDGIRLPDIAVPLATYTGWNLYQSPYPQGKLCDRNGSYAAFAATRAEREAKGDPRLSVQERYASRDDYLTQVRFAAAQLVAERLLLAEDVATYVDAAALAFDAATKPAVASK